MRIHEAVKTFIRCPETIVSMNLWASQCALLDEPVAPGCQAFGKEESVEKIRSSANISCLRCETRS